MSPALARLVSRYPIAAFIGRLAVLVAVYLLLNGLVRYSGNLDITAYRQPVLSIEVFAKLGPWLCGALLLCAVLLARFGGLLSPWNALQAGREIRWLVIALTAAMAWGFGTYEYNFFFDQGHYLDRWLIIALVPLTYWRPFFIYPFLFLSFTIMWQFGQPPIGFGSIFPHKTQVLQVLNLFAAGFLIHAVTGSRRTDDFVVVGCCMIAAAYWVPAISKLELGWLNHGRLYHMPLAAYAHGWLAFLESQQIVEYALRIKPFDRLMLLFTIVFEAGFLVVLWRRTLTITLLSCAIIFHFAVFALYGYVMWTWVAINAVFAALLFRDRMAAQFDIYRPRYFVASIILIGFGAAWFKPSPLAWLDTQLTYTYRLEATGESGQRYDLPPAYFGPYAAIMTMGNFPYLVSGRGNLTGPYAVSRIRERADQLIPVTTSEQVFELEQQVAVRRYDPARAAMFSEFILRYVGNRQSNPERGRYLRLIGPPPQFLSHCRDNCYRDQERIVSIDVVLVTMLFNGVALDTIRKENLMRIEIAGNREPATTYRR